MATIKALEGRTIHQIQSGQVIVDLCSVVKELLENSLDAEATSIEVRFKNHGLDSIEVQDNGCGIASENFATIALKHYTSKLSDYDDLCLLQTFGFRGEALSSLCALSKFHVQTARSDEAPKGTRLDFEVSGALKGNQVVASQKGTTVFVEDIFWNLPVRRRELEKNIKREYGKALGVLQAYACISTQAKITVSNVMAKGKKSVVFATRSTSATRENIANVFGTKTILALIEMDLRFEMRPTRTLTQLSEAEDKQVQVVGHVSRPSFGEGRQAPDRQMFFVNARPCVLPQIAKVFNEVYKSFNLSQVPFVFANIVIDTNAYDVNVSPDKRTILLHEQDSMLESLKASLTALFEKQDQRVPLSQAPVQRLPSFKPLKVSGQDSNAGERTITEDRANNLHSGDESAASDEEGSTPGHDHDEDNPISLIENFVARDSKDRVKSRRTSEDVDMQATHISRDKRELTRRLANLTKTEDQVDKFGELRREGCPDGTIGEQSRAIRDFNERLAEQQPAVPLESDSAVSETTPKGSKTDRSQGTPQSSATIESAFDRMRSRRCLPEVATVTIGSKTTTSILGSSPIRKDTITPFSKSQSRDSTAQMDEDSSEEFTSTLRSFAAPGSELIKTVGRPQSKSHLNHRPPSSSSEEEEEEEEGEENDDNVEVGSRVDHGVHSKAQNEDYAGGNEVFSSTNLASDADDIDEEEKKAEEEFKIAELIRRAEEAAVITLSDSTKRAYQMFKDSKRRPSTVRLIQDLDCSLSKIEEELTLLTKMISEIPQKCNESESRVACSPGNPSTEESLSLTVSKADFANMHIPGQFNLGFILANRDNADLFIIDQHASDEKYNFERLQATVTIQNQPLVQPRTLDLTVIEEEIIIEHNDILFKNGFQVDIDTTGNSPVGERCKLVSLPMSRETTFDVSDLEELISLLAEFSTRIAHESIPRPGKVRRMLAMRACRSSIMVGKTLNLGQMETLVHNMGEIDKPWNCPHGRPTMRHICGLVDWDGWSEGDGLIGLDNEPEEIDWITWAANSSSAADIEPNGNEDVIHAEERRADAETSDND